MKIALIGHSGGGKSTLAQYLATYYQIPLLHLDQLYFLPDWQPRPDTAVRTDLKHFLEDNDNWVIDGVYSKFLLEERLEQADHIFFFNFSRWDSFWRILRRYVTNKGSTRPSAPSGCQESLNWKFLHFALCRSRRKERQAMYQRICQTYADKTIIIRNQKELDQVYEQYKK